MENVEISTTHLDGVPFTPNLSYAQNLTQIADFYHNFINVVTIGIKICQKTCKTQPEIFRLNIRYVWREDSTWRIRSFVAHWSIRSFVDTPNFRTNWFFFWNMDCVEYEKLHVEIKFYLFHQMYCDRKDIMLFHQM